MPIAKDKGEMRSQGKGAKRLVLCRKKPWDVVAYSGGRLGRALPEPPSPKLHCLQSRRMALVGKGSEMNEVLAYIAPCQSPSPRL